MDKIKVGYLPLYIKLYDDGDPHKRDPSVAYMKMLIEILKSQGIEVVEADDVCRLKEEFNLAAEKFKREDVDAVITHHLAYSPSLESIEALVSLEMPIIVFDTTVDYKLVEASNYEARLKLNHGIHGVQDMCNMLKRNEKPYYICCGHIMQSGVIEELCGLCRAARMKKTFNRMKIGSAGGAFTGMGDFRISDERYKEEIGAEVKYLTPETASKYLSEVTEAEIDAEIALDKKKYNSIITFEKEYREATRSGLAFRKWMEDEGIGACTANFLSIDESGLTKMPFIECSKVLERCRGYAGEGDTLTAGLVGALFSVYHDTTFVEMFSPDWDRDVIILSHMGESNPKLAQWKPLLKDVPFNFNSTGNTVSMVTCCRPGKAVYVNLAPMKTGFSLILTEVEVLDLGLERGAYAEVNQGWIKPNMPVRSFLKKYSELGGTHHSAMVYNGDIDTIAAFGKMMGFDVQVI